jgi:hypothetical protein
MRRASLAPSYALFFLDLFYLTLRFPRSFFAVEVLLLLPMSFIKNLSSVPAFS